MIGRRFNLLLLLGVKTLDHLEWLEPRSFRQINQENLVNELARIIFTLEILVPMIEIDSAFGSSANYVFNQLV